MNFRFRKRINGPPGLAINLSKGWPSLSIGGRDATLDGSRCVPRAALGMTGSVLRWQFAGPRHLHKAIQAQAEVKAVHAQGTAKAVQAQAYIIALTNRMETVAKRLTKSAARSSSWKRAAIEQAELLDEMLAVAKESGNDQLISAVGKCHDAWGGDDPHVRVALNSGMTVTDCLGQILAGNQPDQIVQAELLNPPMSATNNAYLPVADETSTNRNSLRLGRQQFHRPLDEAPFWPAFGKLLARNLILLAIGCGLIAGVYTIAARKPTVRPQMIISATPTPEAAAVMLASPEPASTIEVEAPAGTVEAGTSATAPAGTPAPTATPFQHEPVMHDKAPRDKRSTHNSAHRPER